MEKLGIDLKLIAVQIINFGLLLFILKRVLYKPILEIIKKRKEELEGIEKTKEDIEKAKSNLVVEEKKILTDAQNQKEEILKNARRDAEAEKRRIIEKANRES